MNTILDCSFCAALFIPDENSETVSHFFETVSENESLFVPNLWWYEMNNVLGLSVRRNRLKHHDVKQIISLFEEMKLTTDSAFGSHYSDQIFELSQMYQLTAYDAVYLELAFRKDACLATLDKKLRAAALLAGLKVV